MKAYFKHFVSVCLLLLVFHSSSFSTVRLPQLINDGMVLQRDRKIRIWGWAAEGEKITVKFTGKTYRTVTGPEGKWAIELPAQKAGGPYTMDIIGSPAAARLDFLWPRARESSASVRLPYSRGRLIQIILLWRLHWSAWASITSC